MRSTIVQPTPERSTTTRSAHAGTFLRTRPIRDPDSTSFVRLLPGIVFALSMIVLVAWLLSGCETKPVQTLQLDSVAVFPNPLPPLSAGHTQQLTAVGFYNDGSNGPIATGVTWTSSNASVATVNASGLVTGVAPGAVMVVATVTGLSGTASLQVTNASLVSVAVTPGTQTLATGQGVQLTATGNYSDGSTAPLTGAATWTTSNGSVATVSAGLVTGQSVGTATITGSYGGFSSSSTITVNGATLVSVAVQPLTPTLAAGQTTQLTAVGTFSDTTSGPLGSGVTWSSATPSVATVSTSGLVTAVSPGTSLITATSGGISGTDLVTVTVAALQSITVQAASGTIPSGLTTQLTVIGNYTDGTHVPLVSGLTWSSGNPSVAAVDSTGLVTALSPGAAVITAASGAISNTVGLTVTAAVLESIAVTPSSPSMPAGLSTQLTATGTYSDGTSAPLLSGVTWSSGTPAAATVSGTGLVTGVAPGTSVITALSSGISGTTTVTVTTPVLQSLTVQAVSNTLTAGLTTQLTAIGHFSDGTTAPLTSGVSWASGNLTVASVSVSGLVTTILPGVSVVTATFGSFSGTTSITAL